MSILKANRIENLTTTDGGINVNNSGNVGIGTSSPVTQLHIQKATGGLAGVQISSSTYGSTLTDGLFVGIDDSNTYLYNYENTPLTFGTNSTERLRIDSSGHLLVGGSTSIRSGSIEVIQSFADAEINVTESSDSGNGPKLRLTRTRGSNVSSPTAISSGNFMGRIEFDSYDSADYRTGARIEAIASGNWSSSNCPTDLYFSTTSSRSNSPTERMRIDSSGRLLVGTTTEGEATADNLTIEDSGHCGITLRSGTSSVGTIFFSDGTSGTNEYRGYVQYDHSGNYLKWATDATERMRIDSAGRLLVGNTSTNNSGILCVKGNASDSTGGGQISLQRGQSVSGANQHLGDFNFGEGSANTAKIRAFTDANWTGASRPTYMTFETTPSGSSGPTERMRILSSGGLTFNGDTAAANALDDYEEGTFAPTVTGSTTAGTATYAAQRGKYTKIGDRVFFEIYVAWGSGTGSGSQLYVSGLPFTVQTSNATYPAVTIGYWDSVTHGASSSPAALLASGNNYVYFYSIPNGGGGNSAIGYDASGSIILSGHYKVN